MLSKKNRSTLVNRFLRAKGLTLSPYAAAFTLIELLVVITIIVVLLALLTPALDKAVYQAQLASCGGSLKAHGMAAITYAMDHKRHYLFRAGVMDGTAYRPDYLAVTGPDSPEHDDRPALRPYMAINKLMGCLFVEEVEFDRAEVGKPTPNVLLYTSYAYWYGWRYGTVAKSEKGMYRLGDRFEYAGTQFNVLACDTDIIDSNGPWVNNAHPETKDPILYLSTQRGDNINPFVASYATYSYWGTWGKGVNRGPVDRNFAFDDASVARLDGLALDKNEWDDLVIDDKRVEPVPAYTTATPAQAAGYHTWLPRK